MKTRPLAVALVLSLAPVSALPPRVAFAQVADDSSTKMARQRFQEGVAYFDKGQFEMARAAFLQAYALRKHPAVLLNLAQSSLKSGHTLEAARYFQQLLKESAATEAQRTDANRGLADARLKLGHIDVVGASVGADVFVDDDRIGMAPLDHSIDVEPGTHTVRSQGPGGEQSLQVTASAGQGATAKFGGSVTAPVPGAVTPTETPSEATPPPPAEVAPAPATAPLPLPPVEEPSGDRSHHWGWVVATGAITVVGFGFAAIMGAEKSSAQNSANLVGQTILANGGGQGTCYTSATVQPSQYYAGACQALASDNNNVNADATFANVGLIVGGVGAVGLIASIIVTATSYGGSRSAASDRVVLTPIAGKGLGGMSLSGTF